MQSVQTRDKMCISTTVLSIQCTAEEEEEEIYFRIKCHALIWISVPGRISRYRR